MPDPNTKTLQVTVEVDTDEIRQWAEKFADAGKHGLATVLYAFLDHPERFAIGEPVQDDSPPAPGSAVPIADQIVRVARAYGGPVEADFVALADRVEDVEKDNERLYRDREDQERALVEHGRLLSEARAEVERLTDERMERNPETLARVADAIDNLDQAEKVTIDADTGKPVAADLPRPSDVPSGSVYQVEATVWGRNQRLIGVKIWANQWQVYNQLGESGRRKNDEITIVARGVPAIRRRIDDPEGLDQLVARSIIRLGSQQGRTLQRDENGYWLAEYTWFSARDVIEQFGTAEVIWEPEETACGDQ